MSQTGMNFAMLEAGFYLLRLIRAALLEEKPEPKPENVSWHAVWAMARICSLDGLAYYGLVLSDQQPEEALMKAWKRDLMQTVLRQTGLDEDRKVLAKAMDDNGFDYVFMKGIILQDLYPQTGMRQMTDNDILYRLHDHPDPGLKGESQKALGRLMEGLQAETISNDGVVDVYVMDRTSLFEMHRAFLGPDQPLHDYFDQTWIRAKKRSDGCGEYSLSWEDHYILMLAHSHKHFSSGGCGPREIVDAWQFRRMKGSDMDWTYIQKQLERTQLTAYEAMLKRLGSVIFEDATANEEDVQLLEYFLSSGTYGTKENAVRNALNRYEKEGRSAINARIAYVWNRLFPDREYLQTHFPFFSRHRWLIGFLLIYRGGRAMLTKKDRLLQEWEAFSRVSEQKTGKEDRN